MVGALFGNIAPVGLGEQYHVGLDIHLEGVADNVLGGSLVAPLGKERGGSDGLFVSGQHDGTIQLIFSIAVQGDFKVLGTGCADHDGGSVFTLGLGSIGHNDFLIHRIVLAGSNRGLVDAEDAVLVVKGQGGVALQVAALQGEAVGNGFVLEAFKRKLGLVGPEARSLDGRLDTDNHLLVLVEGRAATSEGVQGVVVVAVATPAEVDVVLVGAGVIAVNVEGMTAAKETACDGAEHDGTSLGEFFLDHGSPLCIAVEGSAAAIGAGLLDHAHGLLVIAEELEGINNQDNAVGINAATAGRSVAIGHVLGLTDVAH